jgi:hypothetical protein
MLKLNYDSDGRDTWRRAARRGSKPCPKCPQLLHPLAQNRLQAGAPLFAPEWRLAGDVRSHPGHFPKNRKKSPGEGVFVRLCLSHRNLRRFSRARQASPTHVFGASLGRQGTSFWVEVKTGRHYQFPITKNKRQIPTEMRPNLGAGSHWLALARGISPAMVWMAGNPDRVVGDYPQAAAARQVFRELERAERMCSCVIGGVHRILRPLT